MIDVKYAASNNSYHTKEPFQGTPGSFDLFGAESKVILAKSINTVSTELELAIPKGYYGKINPRSSLIKKFFVTIDGGVLDADFCGTVKTIMINHLRKDVKVNLGERVAQVIFQKKEEVNFIKGWEKELTETSRGIGGFGSTGSR